MNTLEKQLIELYIAWRDGEFTVEEYAEENNISVKTVEKFLSAGHTAHRNSLAGEGATQ